MKSQQPIGQDNPLSPAKNPLQDYSDPKRLGIIAIIAAVGSLFFMGSYLSIMAVVVGTFGVYIAIKKKAGPKIIFINILAIIFGLAINILLQTTN